VRSLACSRWGPDEDRVLAGEVSAHRDEELLTLREAVPPVGGERRPDHVEAIVAAAGDPRGLRRGDAPGFSAAVEDEERTSTRFVRGWSRSAAPTAIAGSLS